VGCYGEALGDVDGVVAKVERGDEGGAFGEVAPLPVEGRADGGAVDSAFAVLGAHGGELLVGIESHAVHGNASGTDNGSGAAVVEVVEQGEGKISGGVWLAEELSPEGRLEGVADELGDMALRNWR